MSFINKMNIGNVSYDIQAGEKVQLTFPAGATKGTLTDEQLASLQANYQSCIEMVNDKEIYTLNDPGHVEGYLTYSHVGIENSKATIKTLTITVSAKSFVIVTTVVPTESGGGKLYRHVVNATLNNSINDKDMSVTFIYYRSDTKSFKTAFDNQDYSVIKDLKYGTVILRFYKPDNDTAPCQGIGNLADMSKSGNSSPNISNDDIYGVIYTLSGSFYYLMSYPMIVKEVSSEDITEV